MNNEKNMKDLTKEAMDLYYATGGLVEKMTEKGDISSVDLVSYSRDFIRHADENEDSEIPNDISKLQEDHQSFWKDYIKNEPLTPKKSLITAIEVLTKFGRKYGLIG